MRSLKRRKYALLRTRSTPHGICFRRPFRLHAGAAPRSAVAQLGIVRRLRGSCSKIGLRYTPDMATIAEVEKLAFDLPDSDRALLAAHLLRSLPSVLHDEDEGLAEALRRDAELDANPEAGISLDQLDQRIRAHRR